MSLAGPHFVRLESNDGGNVLSSFAGITTRMANVVAVQIGLGMITRCLLAGSSAGWQASYLFVGLGFFFGWLLLVC